MESMPSHPRLFLRRATYYHRAAIPADIKDTYPKSEETFSLKTGDYQKALKLLREAAAMVDRKFDQHRREQARLGEPYVSDLSEAEIKHIGEAYYASILKEDDDQRQSGFREQEEGPNPTPLSQLVNPGIFQNQIMPAPHTLAELEPEFDDWVQHVEQNEKTLRDLFKRGKIPPFFLGEAEDVLTWDTVGIRLDPKSPSFKSLARELIKVSILAQQAKHERNQGKIVDTPAVEPKAATAAPVALMSVALKEWIKEKSRSSWNTKTEHAHQVWTRHFMAIAGDKPLDSYVKADARHFKGVLLKLPANWNKFDQLKSLSMVKAAERAKHLKMAPMSENNVNKILGILTGFWNWAEANYDEAPANLFKGLKIKISTSVRDERNPFTPDELKTIFDAPLYRGCQSVRKWKYPGDLVPREAGIFWVPLIGLFSGARMGEIIQLYVKDIKQKSGIFYFDINDDGDDKRLKNSNSKRLIPVHQQLVTLGFLDFVAIRKKQNQARLFPELTMGDDGYYSSPFSKHFNRFLKSIDVKTPKNSFHSFRHNFEDACRDSDVSKDIMDQLQGHGSEGMSGRYGQGFSLEKLGSAMKRLQYQNLSLSHLNK